MSEDDGFDVLDGVAGGADGGGEFVFFGVDGSGEDVGYGRAPFL